jgi:hypothetical protein
VQDLKVYGLMQMMGKLQQQQLGCMQIRGRPGVFFKDRMAAVHYAKHPRFRIHRLFLQIEIMLQQQLSLSMLIF